MTIGSHKIRMIVYKQTNKRVVTALKNRNVSHYEATENFRIQFEAEKAKLITLWNWLDNNWDRAKDPSWSTELTSEVNTIMGGASTEGQSWQTLIHMVNARLQVRYCGNYDTELLATTGMLMQFIGTLLELHSFQGDSVLGQPTYMWDSSIKRQQIGPDTKANFEKFRIGHTDRKISKKKKLRGIG